MIKLPFAVGTRTHHSFQQIADTVQLEDVHGTILVLDFEHPAYLPALRMMMHDCRFLHRTQKDAACELFFRISVDIVLLNHSPENPAIPLLKLFKTIKPSVPVLVLAENSTESLAIEAFRNGARDYFRMPLRLDEVERTLRALLKIRSGWADSVGGLAIAGMDKSINYIQENYKSSITLKKIAEKTGVSLSTLARLIKKRTGMTFVDYVNSLRIHAACKMLRDPGFSLLQIALECGYSNQSHFNRVFKKLLGVSPGQYRKALIRHSR